MDDASFPSAGGGSLEPPPVCFDDARLAALAEKHPPPAEWYADEFDPFDDERCSPALARGVLLLGDWWWVILCWAIVIFVCMFCQL